MTSKEKFDLNGLVAIPSSTTADELDSCHANLERSITDRVPSMPTDQAI